MLKSELKAEEYRARAADAAASAEAATLDQIRELRRQAAARWVELAELEEARAEKSRALLRSVADSGGDPHAVDTEDAQ
jgi:hypothetical protein